VTFTRKLAVVYIVHTLEYLDSLPPVTMFTEKYYEETKYSIVLKYFDRIILPSEKCSTSFLYPEPFLRAVNRARRGALAKSRAKSISNWHLIGYNEGYCSNTGYILLPCFYGTWFWIWPEPLVAPRMRRALDMRMCSTSAK
jgi:hypothetical protein